jgi:hypothetical protein
LSLAGSYRPTAQDATNNVHFADAEFRFPDVEMISTHIKTFFSIFAAPASGKHLKR